MRIASTSRSHSSKLWKLAVVFGTFSSLIAHGTRSMMAHSTALFRMTQHRQQLLTVFGAFAPIADFNPCTASVAIAFNGVSPICRRLTVNSRKLRPNRSTSGCARLVYDVRSTEPNS